MIDIPILIKTIVLILSILLLIPMFLAISRFITNFLRIRHTQFNIGYYYKTAIKTLCLGFSSREDIWSFVFFWMELTIATLILSILQFPEKISDQSNWEYLSIIKPENNLIVIMALVVVFNTIPFLKIEISNKNEKFLLLGHFIVRFGSAIYMILSIYISLLMAYGVSDISRIVEMQKDIFPFGIFKWGVFLNPFSALLFFILIILSSGRLVSEQRERIYGSSNHIFIEKCSEMVKLICLITLFIHLFLGGFGKIDFLPKIVGQNSDFGIFIQIILWLIKFLFLFGILSFVNYFLMSLTNKNMGKIVVSWFMPLGAISIFYAWIWSL